jgi:hypothetical protein
MPEIPVTVERERETVEVYGAEPAVRVTVEEAVAQPDIYHLDGAGRVWLQEFWRSINGSELAAVATSGGMR